MVDQVTSSPVLSAVYAAAANGVGLFPPSELLPVRGMISHTYVSQAAPIIVDLASVPGIASRLGRVSLATVATIKLRFWRLPGRSVDIAAAVIPNHGTASHTVDSAFMVSTASYASWRHNITTPEEVELTLEWPPYLVSRSLIGVAPGAYAPALLLAFRDVGTSNNLAAGDELRISVIATLECSGRGYW